jgi:hypothetical protein
VQHFLHRLGAQVVRGGTPHQHGKGKQRQDPGQRLQRTLSPWLRRTRHAG